MKQYLDTLRYVKDNGVMRGDRTGKGRHGVFSPPDEIYDLAEGYPLAGFREVKPDAMVDELIWFISGSTITADLKYGFFWDRWTTTKADVIAYVKSISLGTLDDHTDEQVLAMADKEVLARVGTIGNLYGVSWRNAPAPKGLIHPTREPSQYPRKLVEQYIPVVSLSDWTEDQSEDVKIGKYEQFIKYLETPSPLGSTMEELRLFCLENLHNEYWSKYDQLNELIVKLKTTPNSSRLRVTAYVTDYMAFEEFSPQQNTMDGRAALTACHTFFQCFVNPGVDGGKPKLDLKLTLTSSDVPVGRVYNIAQYALLTHMLAQTCDMDVGRLIISTGDAHIYSDQFEAVDTILAREPGPMPTLWLNPEIKDIFAFTAADIRIENYNPQPAVKIPVAV